MKILVEAMCADYGGIATYVTNLLRAWPTVFPDDEVHVIAPREAVLPRAGLVHHERIVRRPVSVSRPAVQTAAVYALARSLKPDVVLATLPSTTIVRCSAPTAVVIYDLRHELRPEQFPFPRRVLRRISYARGYAVADGFLSISRRSLEDLHRLHPRTRDVPAWVTHLGADHVDEWPRDSPSGDAVAFGHHSNKNTDMVLQAWAALREGLPDQKLLPRLRLIGVSSVDRPRMASMITELRLSDYVSVEPFLPDDQFHALMASAGLVVFPSNFEGFGLPVLESMRLGIPVVVGPDPAVLEIAGGHATVMSVWTHRALADAVRAALDVTVNERAAAVHHAAAFTWEATARTTRDALMLIAGCAG